MKTDVPAEGRLSVRQERENFDLGCSGGGNHGWAVRKKQALDGDQGSVTKTGDPGLCVRLENSRSWLALKPLIFWKGKHYLESAQEHRFTERF